MTFFMAAMPAMGMAAMRTDVKCSDKGNGLYEGPGQLGERRHLAGHDHRAERRADHRQQAIQRQRDGRDVT